MHKRRILTVDSVVQETRNSVSIHFHQPGTDKVWYKPGQYLTLVAAPGENQVYRCYSISTAPRLDRTLGITVKAKPGGVLSEWLMDTAQPGWQVEAIDPRGRFTSDISVKNRRTLAFIAGGSGIAPIYSLLRSVLFGEPHSQVVLWYANRTIEETIFYSELQRLERMFRDRLSIRHFFSGNQERISASALTWLSQSLEQVGIPVSWWICGPAGLSKLAENTLRAAGSTDVHTECFDLDDAEASGLADADGLEPQVVRVSHMGRQYTFGVPAGATVLEAAISQGINLPHSCKRGVCSACVARLLKGSVRLSRPDAMLDFEVQRGLTLLCQAHPLDNQFEAQTGFNE